MASKPRVVQLRASRSTAQAPEDAPQAGLAEDPDQAVADHLGIYVTPQSSLVITRNSRGYGYELKIFVDDAYELLDPEVVLAQVQQFDAHFKRLFVR